MCMYFVHYGMVFIYGMVCVYGLFYVLYAHIYGLHVCVIVCKYAMFDKICMV